MERADLPPIKEIESIQFGLLSPKQIRKMAVAVIRNPDTYSEDGRPIDGGVMDSRLGSMEPRQSCRTCGHPPQRCPGHFGYIELARPVIHVGFADVIYDLLRAFCRKCSRILLPEKRIKEIKRAIKRIKKERRRVPRSFHMQVLREAASAKVCPYCGARQFKIEFTKPAMFFEETESGGVRKLSAIEIRNRFEKIKDSDLELVGINPKTCRPEWMILTVLPVPPVCIRPSIILETGIRSEDDLTHKLVDIVRINERLRENMEQGSPTPIIDDLTELLQYHVTTYFNNEAPGIPPARHRSGRPLKTLFQRLKGKDGRFRGNLSGKRVDYCARAVISPDPFIGINEVGVPESVAKILTVPEKVTEFNVERMRQLVLNGPEKYPGAVYVIRPDGNRIRLEYAASREAIAESLAPGWIVERHLVDGDIVLFNRQPSLHRMSIMAHYVRVLPGNTFRLNLCVCPPYNADFDGDEMNLHVPQSEEARSEAEELLAVQNQILSPRYGGPIIGAVKDFITGAYLLTRKETLLNKKQVCRLLASVGYEGPLLEPAIKEPEPKWTGKQIFSLFIPKGINYVGRANICANCKKCLKEKCPYDAYVVVKDGELICGVIDKSSIGAEKCETLYHQIVKEYGVEVGMEFLDKITKLVTHFLTMYGFTYSLDELDVPKELKEQIRKVIDKYIKRALKLVEEYRKGKLVILKGKTPEESLEIYIMNELSRARDEAGAIVDKYFTLDNSGIIMTKTGARGSALNIGQMTACLGQQAVRGKRIYRGYRDRVLPHFKPGDPSPLARGFVVSSFRDGLSPVEFFFHAMGGREGLVDTAVRTQQSGYMQRRLINALEELKVEYDGTVRDSTGTIVQFRYGEDGVDPGKSDHGRAVNVRRLVERIAYVDRGTPAPKSFILKKLKEYEEFLNDYLINELKNALLEAKLSKDGVLEVIERTVRAYQAAQIEPGEAVGIVTSQSIGEPGTQMTLRTFHYAGVRERDVTVGLPRLIEIVDARKKPSTPSMVIYLDEEHRKDEEKAKEVAKRIKFTCLESVTDKIDIDLGPDGTVLTVKLDSELLSDRGLTAKDVYQILSKKYSKYKISMPREGVIKIKAPVMTRKKLMKFLKRIGQTKLKGIKGIKNVMVTKEGDEWLIYTYGSNLKEVLKVPGVDPTRTITNDIFEIAEVLGIEAARNAIMREIKEVLDEQGLDVDIRHVMLIADAMTYKGRIMRIGRYGLSGTKRSPLARAAFEVTVKVLLRAALRGEEDIFRGVVENIIAGKTVPVGTGLVELYYRAT